MAPVGHSSTHLPHFEQERSGRLRVSAPECKANCGHPRSHFPQSLQASWLTRTVTALSQLVADWKAPKGQNRPHCVRRFVSTGKTITKAVNRDRKMTACTARVIESTCGYSVTVLNGQSHMQ